MAVPTPRAPCTELLPPCDSIPIRHRQVKTSQAMEHEQVGAELSHGGALGCIGRLDDGQLHTVLSRTPLIDAVAFGATSRRNYRLIKDHIRLRVCLRLEHYDLSPPDTLNAMQAHRIIMSGSNVLEIMSPGHFEPGDLDLYVPCGAVEAAEAFILKNPMYRALGDVIPARSPYMGESDDGVTQTGIITVKYYAHELTGRLINIIETRLTSSPSAIFAFHSTVVMNFVTWNGLVSGYPLSTCKGFGFVNACRRKHPRKLETCLEKYMNRGYTYLETCKDWKEEHVCGQHGYCALTERRIGDAWTMRISLAGELGSLPDVVDDELQWRLACRTRCGGGIPSSGKVVAGIGGGTIVKPVMTRKRGESL
ncbi:hypothetical protein NMY22_g12831 [Coprinellus aureogranulatus]|nr:hypothetical protein NMY22_g12831 [Coprinellus aureogranulatus]